MAVPVVAIVGRPNVGKSSLFNCLAGKRIAIVDPTAGVTRDRVSTLIPLDDDRYFELFDTGGMGIQDVDNLTQQIEGQIQQAIEQAHLVLFVVDIRDGIAPLDQHVAERLRAANKPVMLLANKCDVPELEPQANEFYRLGYGDVMPISAHHRRGREKLMAAIQERLPEVVETPKPVAMKIAIVGRRNTGKSTFINCLAQSERMIVSEVPGTTRDSVDVAFERDGLSFIAIDTAGVRRKKSLADDVEFYSMARAERSIRRADVVLLFLDAAEPISKVDKQLAEYILDQNKPAIFVANKWDLMKPLPTSKFADYVHKTFPSLDFMPISFITAKDNRNVYATLNLAQTMYKQAQTRITTGELNRVLQMALESSPPPMRQNRRAKVYFATQVSVTPPTIVLFTNGPELFDNTYQRYLLKTFRDHLPFNDIPIKMYLRNRTQVERPEGEQPERRKRGENKQQQQPELWSDV